MAIVKYLVLFCFLVTPVAVKGYDDDDEDWFTDVAVGFAVGLCDANATCGYYLGLFSMCVCVVVAVMWCVGVWAPEPRDLTFKRVGRTGGGYVAGRVVSSFFD